jgi:hypothetical protein
LFIFKGSKRRIHTGRINVEDAIRRKNLGLLGSTEMMWAFSTSCVLTDDTIQTPAVLFQRLHFLSKFFKNITL